MIEVHGDACNWKQLANSLLNNSTRAAVLSVFFKAVKNKGEAVLTTMSFQQPAKHTRKKNPGLNVRGREERTSEGSESPPGDSTHSEHQTIKPENQTR
ncbi:MAG: hypothetical protein ABUS47_01470 [Steroidobacter sp.]